MLPDSKKVVKKTEVAADVKCTKQFALIGLLTFSAVSTILVQRLFREVEHYSMFSLQFSQNYSKLHSPIPTIPEGVREGEIRRRKSFFCGGKWLTRYSQLHDDILKGRAPQKFLVYNNEIEISEGYGNRIYGITTLFYLAVLTDRAFLINWTNPKPLETYLQPRDIAWNFSLRNIQHLNASHFAWSSGNLSNARARGGSVISEQDDTKRFVMKTDFGKLFNESVVVATLVWNILPAIFANPRLMRTSRAKGVKQLLRGGGNKELRAIGCAFDSLFKQTDLVKTRIDRAKQELQLDNRQFLVGLHIRAGDDLSFITKRLNLKSKDYLKCFITDAIRIEGYLQRGDLPSSNVSWFLATDNLPLKKLVVKKYKWFKTLSLEPHHISREPATSAHAANDDDVFLDVLADHFTLSNCNFLILSNPSSFGKTAASVGMFFKEEFKYPPCRRPGLTEG